MNLNLSDYRNYDLATTVHSLPLASGVWESLTQYESSLSGRKCTRFGNTEEDSKVSKFCSYSSLGDASSLAPFNLLKFNLLKGSHLPKFPSLIALPLWWKVNFSLWLLQSSLFIPSLLDWILDSYLYISYFLS